MEQSRLYNRDDTSQEIHTTNHERLALKRNDGPQRQHRSTTKPGTQLRTHDHDNSLLPASRETRRVSCRAMLQGEYPSQSSTCFTHVLRMYTTPQLQMSSVFRASVYVVHLDTTPLQKSSFFKSGVHRVQRESRRLYFSKDRFRYVTELLPSHRHP